MFLSSKLCHFIAPLFVHFKHFLPFVRILCFANRASGITHLFCLSCSRYFCHFVVSPILPLHYHTWLYTTQVKGFSPQLE